MERKTATERIREVLKTTVWAVLPMLMLGCQRGPQVRFSSAEQLLNRLYERTSCSRGLVGDARIEIAGPFAHYEGKLLFKAGVTERLRFDLYSDFGVSLATLATDGNQLSFFDLPNNTLIVGTPNACNLARFTQVQVPPFALVELLRGRPPVLEHQANAAQLSFKSPWFQEGRYVLQLKGKHDAEETIWFVVPPEDWSLSLDRQRVYLSKVRVKQAGRVSYSVELSDYRTASRASLAPTAEEREMGITQLEPSGPECQAELPYRLSFDVGRGGHTLHIRATELTHNPPLSPSSYELNVPRGAQIVRSTCQ